VGWWQDQQGERGVNATAKLGPSLAALRDLRFADAGCEDSGTIPLIPKYFRARVMLGRQVDAVFVPPPKEANPVRRMQKDQLQAGHTTPRSHNGHRASERPPCCHKESAAASCLSFLAREPSKRHWCQLFAFERTASARLSIDVQPTLPACWRLWI
jgi:hypothetical protein